VALPIPEFGRAASGAEYLLRPGGYAVILSDAGEVAIVSTPQGFFLPGGGQDAEESPQDAAVREAREECGLQIVLGKCIGAADELVFAADEEMHYRKRCVFFFAEVAAKLGTDESDHRWFGLHRRKR
jgi:8-oxo-dGTP diphosphatase